MGLNEHFKGIAKSMLRRAGFTMSRVQPWQDNYSWIIERDIATVIDVGANDGEFIRFITKILPEVKVHAFEPIGSVFELLKKRTGGLGVTYHRCALGETNETTQIHVNNFSPSSSILNMTERHLSNYAFATESHLESIQVMTGDSALDFSALTSNILMKIDVQGYEKQVIAGAQNILKHTEVVICEVSFRRLYEGQGLFHDVYADFNQLGFVYAGNMNQFYEDKTGLPLFADCIFLRTP